MIYKEKAKELINRMHLFASGDSGKDDLTKANAKQCAKIAVYEKIATLLDIIGTQEHMWSEHEKYTWKGLHIILLEIENYGPN